jgi:hypothetical protein
MGSIAELAGCTADNIRLWVRQAEQETGKPPRHTTDERERPQTASQAVYVRNIRPCVRTDVVLDALEQALHDREFDGWLIVHTDRSSPFVAMRDNNRLTDTRAAPSVGSAGDAFDTALAEVIIGLYETEAIGGGRAIDSTTWSMRR